MAKPKKPKFDLGELELMYTPGEVGAVLKAIRERQGISLLQLKALSGVSDSEISKVENGKQECRLGTFFKLISSLGLKAGDVMDDVVRTSLLPFLDALHLDSEFYAWGKMHNKCWHPEGSFEVPLAMQVACYAAVAAHLSRCTNPMRMALRLTYPDEETRVAFEDFALQMATLDDPIKRLEVLVALRANPFQSLRRWGLFIEASLVNFASEANKLPTHPKKTITVGSEGIAPWMPYVPPFGHKHIVDTYFGSPNVADMNAAKNLNLWDDLSAKLKRAMEEERGMQAWLAEKLGVTPQAVNRWLSGDAAPNANLTLRLKSWIERGGTKAQEP